MVILPKLKKIEFLGSQEKSNGLPFEKDNILVFTLLFCCPKQLFLFYGGNYEKNYFSITFFSVSFWFGCM